jgi:hypothetical protein
MTGDQDGIGIGLARGSDRTGSASGRFGDACIALRLAPGNLGYRGPDALLERCANPCQRQGKR